MTEVSVVEALNVASAIIGASPTNSPVDISATCKFTPEDGEEVTVVVWGRPPLVHIVVSHLGHDHGFLTGPTEESLGLE